MAKPRRSSPARDLLFRVDEADAQRAEAAALEATRETSKIVPVTEMYRRTYLAGLALVESCAGCRAGKCDVDHAQVRQHEPTDKPNGINEVCATFAVPKSVATNDTSVGQVGLFAQVPAAPPGKAKAPRKPKVVDENSPERVRLIDEFHLAYIAARGTKPPYTKRDWKAFDELLAAIGYDRASECIRNAFADPFWAPKVTIRDIAANPSKFAGTKAPELRPRSTQDEPLPRDWS